MPTSSAMSTPQEPARAATGTVAGRCAECGARVRPDDQWCTLCLTPVAVPAPPEPAGRPAAEPAARRTGEPTGRPGDDAGDEVAERDAAEAAERMLVELRAGEAHRLPPRLAAIRPRTKAAEAVLACLGGLVMVGVLFGALYVVGRLL